MRMLYFFLTVLLVSETYAVSMKSGSNNLTSSEDSFFIQIDGTSVDLRYSALVAESYNLSRASGFFARVRNKNFIITNLKLKGKSFVKSFQLMDGGEFIRNPKGFVAKNKDVYMIPVADNDIPEGYTPIPVSANVNEFVKVGDKVKIVGVHSSDGVLQVVDTYVGGIASQKLTLRNNPFSIGSLGSPVIHVNSGMCIGVVTCDFIKVSERGNVDRDFLGLTANYKSNFYVSRIDTVKNWITCDAKNLELLNEVMNKVSLTITYLKVMLNDMSKAGSSFSFRFDSDAFKDIDTLCWECAEIMRNYNTKVNLSGKSYTFPHPIVRKARREFFSDIKRLILPIRSLLLSSKAYDILPNESQQMKAELDIIFNEARRNEDSPLYR